MEINESKTKLTIIGRYTIVELTSTEGVKGVGMARRAQGDKIVRIFGVNIATGRAIKAINKKMEKKRLNHPLMG